jgi:alpha-mannosidase
MEKHLSHTQRRIQQFIEFQLRELLITRPSSVDAQLLIGAQPNEDAARAAKNWQPIAKGETWGPAYTEGWYHLKGSLPAVPDGFAPVLVYGDDPQFRWEPPNMLEGTIWDNNAPVGGIDHGHEYFRLDPDRALDLLIQTWAWNSEVTVFRPEKPRNPLPQVYRGFAIALLDEERLPLFYDAEFAQDLMASLPPDDPAATHLLRALNEVCNTFSESNRKSWRECRKILKAALGSITSETNHTIHAMGHAHLDTAWLWPLAITRLKMAHTTAIQLGLAERYPNHLYVHSQASQYEWLEVEHPDLFQRVKRAARAGNWEPVGSMWVEADCNLTGGESLVRQFLYGRNYFRQHFGTSTIDMWLPDVFGYSAALPQILCKFNIKAFLTQKMSWNAVNKIPHNTFYWQGIDGSKIFTHFPPADTYIADCSPREIAKSVKNHRDHARSDHSLYLFGFGDGGGGPTEWHIERLNRARLAPGLPMIEPKASAKSFYETAIADSQDLLTWTGELYLEFHRGTYTSQADCKAANRRCEFLLRDAELLSAYHPNYPESYPAADLEAAWKLVLLNQFHDIIPGSSVAEVYVDAHADYAKAQFTAETAIKAAISAVARGLKTDHYQNPIALYHQAEVETQATLPDPDPTIASLHCSEGQLPVQHVDLWGQKQAIFATPTVARNAITIAGFSPDAAQTTRRLKASNRKLESDDLAVRFDQHGNITSITTQDEVPLEFIIPGRLANLFQLLDDRPPFWDAWDTELYAHETAIDLVRSSSFEVVERGPVRVAVELTKQFGKSTIKQRISLGPTPGIRFDTWIDWKEAHKFLKVLFPINVNTTKSTCEIQFGHVERPTHRNTTWDMAKFEVCAQKWVDLSEGGHGVALINTGKYGHDIHNSDLRLSLLRSPKAPDPTCDMGIHQFTYVIYPHFDQVPQSDVVAAAYAINAPVHIVPIDRQTGNEGELPPFIQVSSRNIIVESVKKAEASNHRIVRLYECHNTRGHATLNAALPIKQAWLCDLEENPLQELEVVDGAVNFGYLPFEILTIALLQ